MQFKWFEAYEGGKSLSNVGIKVKKKSPQGMQYTNYINYYRYSDFETADNSLLAIANLILFSNPILKSAENLKWKRLQ